jgi:bis(5'-nucleosyl)-tetraphosphatase (symmetrical)
LTATYVLGDVHGCYASLRELLRRIRLDLDRDRLWLVGDLVNRGPHSLQLLRWARGLSERLGERMVVVLGNHDVHLLARHAGVAEPRSKDLLDDVLEAPDGHRLLRWLRRRPLLHRDGDHLLVHAGLDPSWTPEEAERRAAEVAERLRSPAGDPLLSRRPPEDGDALELWTALSTFVRLRTCTEAGEPCDFSGPPDEAPPGCLPWFRVPGRRSAGATVLFGHWSALGLHREPGVRCLDDGAAWGGRLTALRLEDGRIFQQPVTETETPPHLAAKAG